MSTEPESPASGGVVSAQVQITMHSYPVVSAGGGTIIVIVQGSAITERDLVEEIYSRLIQKQRNNGGRF